MCYRIRLLLHQNSVIPKEKQLQFFDLNGDKVWFESEYQRELYEYWKDDAVKTKEIASMMNWTQKQIDYYKVKFVETTPDDWFDCIKVLGIPVNQIDVGMPIMFTEDKREDEEPMSNAAIKVEVMKSGTFYVPEITDIEIIVPEKVVKVIFVDGTNMKMVCHKEDTFDLRRCLFIAIAKKLFKDRYTWEGIEYKATELSYLKSANRVVDKALKDYKNKIKEEEKEEKKATDKKRAVENQKRKHAEYVKRRDARRQKEIDEKNRQKFEYDVAVQVEAARRIREMNPEYQVEKYCEEFCNDWDGK